LAGEREETSGKLGFRRSSPKARSVQNWSDDEARNQLRGGRPWWNTFPDNHLGASRAVARSRLEPSYLVGVLFDKVWELPDGLGPFCGGFSDHNLLKVSLAT